MKSKKWLFAKKFEGPATEANFQLKEEKLPALKDGDVLFEAEYFSLDPYMRVWHVSVGSTMIGEQLARVIESKNAHFKVGEQYLVNCGWRTHTVINPDEKQFNITTLPDLGELHISLALGVAGMTGATGYLGLLKVCKPRAGETVLVSAAAGAVGNVVGQIAKIKGCKVIGYAGTDEKCDWLRGTLGFDYAFNYKTCDLDATLTEAAPGGVDCFFDCVGGDFSAKVLENHVKNGTRIVKVGAISNFNTDERSKDPYEHIPAGVKMTGFGIMRQPKQDRNEAQSHIIQWIREGKLQWREHVTEGFENLPQAFLGLFSGDNIGKTIVKM